MDQVKLPKWLNSTTLAFVGVLLTAGMAWQNLSATQDFHSRRLDSIEQREERTTTMLQQLAVTVAEMNVNMRRLTEDVAKLIDTKTTAQARADPTGNAANGIQ